MLYISVNCSELGVFNGIGHIADPSDPAKFVQVRYHSKHTTPESSHDLHAHNSGAQNLDFCVPGT